MIIYPGLSLSALHYPLTSLQSACLTSLLTSLLIQPLNELTNLGFVTPPCLNQLLITINSFQVALAAEEGLLFQRLREWQEKLRYCHQIEQVTWRGDAMGGGAMGLSTDKTTCRDSLNTQFSSY